MNEHMTVLSDGSVFVDYGPSSMVITAKKDDTYLTKLSFSSFELLKRVLAEISENREVLSAYPKDRDFSKVKGTSKIMCDSVLLTGEETLTPMASVAGTVADIIADYLYENGADFVAVNNGGDTAVRLSAGKEMRIGILPVLGGELSRVVTIKDTCNIGGVCTSGLGGRSFTRGVADSVTVFARTCSIADAFATHLANKSYIESPNVQTMLAGDIDSESDIKDLRIVTGVDRLSQHEKETAVYYVKAEAEKHLQKGSILYAAVSVQGVTASVPECF